jgi:hypothetical protein
MRQASFDGARRPVSHPKWRHPESEQASRLRLARSRRIPAPKGGQQALKAYQQRGDTVVVQIKLVLPAAYKTDESNQNQNSPDVSASLRPGDFWRNFRFDLKQRGRVVAPRSSHSNPIYSMPAKAKRSVLDGARVLLVYDAKDVASEEVTIEVRTPESKTITFVFDLKKLR